MKKWSFLFLMSTSVAIAQVESKSNVKDEIVFTVVQNNAHGHVEDQCQTGTCWSFATVSFLEAEAMRIKKVEVDLSEMVNPRYMYTKKVDSYVRFQGKQQLGPGGLSHDAIQVMREFGVVPESAYSGFVMGEDRYNHNVLDAYLEALSKLVVDKKLNEDNNDWKVGIESLLDTYIGKLPTQFDYNGKKYTPETFRNELGLNPNDYVMLTSFSHHPFYSSFVLEVPDNWSKGQYFNLPLNEFQAVADNALKTGYTIAWDADVSEVGFSFRNNMALLPMSPFKKEELFTQKPNEIQVTQESRQADFDSFATTDDHLMHIVGTSKDQWGNLYYLTKNSWGEKNSAKGYQYVSQSYFRGKTVCMVVHKDAVPADIRKKMGL
jgi:bleomycin hydrolase